jgi:hypothetical protein
MRWTFRSLLGVFLLWVVYILSPYAALYSFANAVQARDTAAITARVDFQALRISLAKQLAAAYLKATAGDKSSSDTSGLAASAGATVLDPLIAAYVTPQAIVDIFSGQPSASPIAIPAQLEAPSLSDISFERLKQLFLTTETRGFRVFVVGLPYQRPPEERFRLVFRLTGPSEGFTWRIGGLELPDSAKDRIVTELVKRGTT